jgi:hypothetical protein
MKKKMKNMKTIVKVSLVFTGLFVFSCKNKTETLAETAVTQKTATAKRATKPLTIQDETVNAIYPHYLALTTALTEEKVAEAKIVSSNIEAGAAELKSNQTLKKYATQIIAADDIGQQRSAYAKLSDEFIALVKKAGVKNGQLYRNHCPMAFDGKGASWLSPSKEIRNPYYGEEMLTCGSVEDTIKGTNQ